MVNSEQSFSQSHTMRLAEHLLDIDTEADELTDMVKETNWIITKTVHKENMKKVQVMMSRKLCISINK